MLLAVSSLKSLGPLCILFGFGGAGVIAFFSTPPNHFITFPVAWFPIAVGTFVGVLGIAYSVCGIKLRRGSLTAAFIALILAAFNQGLVLLLGIPGLLLLFMGEFAAALLLLFIPLLFTFGLLDLMVHLYRFIRWRRRL